MTAADPQPPQLIPPGTYVVDRDGYILEGEYKGQRIHLPHAFRVTVTQYSETIEHVRPVKR